MEIEGTTRVIIYTLGGGLGAWLACRIFGCNLNPLAAFGIAGLASLFYLIPTVGFAAALFVMVVLIRQFSDGDWQDALYTTFGANGVVLCVALLWQVGAA